MVDVSGNEILTNESVSGNDAAESEVITEIQVQYMTGEYDAEMLVEMQKTNYLLTALLFFTVFTWISQKLHNSVKKVVSIDE